MNNEYTAKLFSSKHMFVMYKHVYIYTRGNIFRSILKAKTNTKVGNTKMSIVNYRKLQATEVCVGRDER